MSESETPRPAGEGEGLGAAAKIGIAGIVVAVVAIVASALVAIAIAQCWCGLGSCPPEAPDVRIDAASSVFNAPDYDDPADEYVCLVSADDASVNLAGWQLRESNGDVVNTLPSFTLAPGAAVRVHPGKGRDSRRDLFGTHNSPIWRNGADSMTLVDADGNEISSASYRKQEENRPATRVSSLLCS